MRFTPTAQEYTINLPPANVYVGAEIFARVTCLNVECHFGSDSERQYLQGTILATPIGSETGTLLTPALELPERQALLAWVRHQGGAVALAAVEGENRHTLIPTEVREAVNLDGEVCTERAFVMTEGLPASGPLAFALDLNLQGGEEMRVFDYGVMLL